MLQNSKWDAGRPAVATKSIASSTADAVADRFRGPRDGAIEDQALWQWEDDVSRRRQQGMQIVRRSSVLSL